MKQGKGIKEKTLAIAKAFWQKFQDLWKVRENDEDFLSNTYTGEENKKIAEGDFYGQEARNIPIFHVKRLKKQEDLLKNFSTGITFLMGTAVNYHEMNKVKNVVELMAEYASNVTADTEKVELLGNSHLKILKSI